MAIAIRSLMLLTFVVLIGCTPKIIEMDAATKESLIATQHITAIHYIHPVFELPPYSTSGGVIGGLMSGIVDRSRGERIEEKFGLYDPILDVKENFLTTVLNEFPSLTISKISAPFANDEVHDLKGPFSKGYILDFQTRRWGIVQHVEGWEHLKPPGSQERRKVTFIARARLIDANQESILWQGICDVEDHNNIFTMEDVQYWYNGENNNLDNLFTILASTCLKELWRQFPRHKRSLINRKNFVLSTAP